MRNGYPLRNDCQMREFNRKK